MEDIEFTDKDLARQCPLIDKAWLCYGVCSVNCGVVQNAKRENKFEMQRLQERTTQGRI